MWDLECRRLNKCSLCGLECSEVWVVELIVDERSVGGLRIILLKPIGMSVLRGSEHAILFVGLFGVWTFYFI